MTKKSPLSTLEKAGVLVCLLILAALLTWFVRYIGAHSEVVNEAPYASNLPASGQFAKVESVTTGWLKSEWENTVFPTATITLDPSFQGSGELRILFKKNAEEGARAMKSVGDSNSAKVTNGTFSNGTNSLTVTCTKGLDGMAGFLAYQSQTEERWVLELLEPQEETSEFQAFAQAPIEPVMLDDK